MRSGLKDGKLVPPRSLRVAQTRYDRLRDKIASVEAQLTDPKRDEPAWREKAKGALAAFESERYQLRTWIAETLLHRCRDALRSFKADGADLTAVELELLEQLDGYFNKETDDAGR